ncbi:MAG TPA: hypothetical protein PKA31_00905 [Candidatus Moranbacteria bacterium]|nr:hypothetical protein [Candidatus Moranbacteria bacterium]
MATKHECPHCAARDKAEGEQHEFQLSVLLAMVPLMVFTLFGQMGLF